MPCKPFMNLGLLNPNMPPSPLMGFLFKIHCFKMTTFTFKIWQNWFFSICFNGKTLFNCYKLIISSKMFAHREDALEWTIMFSYITKFCDLKQHRCTQRWGARLFKTLNQTKASPACHEQCYTPYVFGNAIFFTIIFSNPTHQTKIYTAYRWKITNN
jgi:hypothetical protein